MSGIRAKARAAALVWAGPRSSFSDDEDHTTALPRSLVTDLAGIRMALRRCGFDPGLRTVSVVGRKDWPGVMVCAASACST
jgi:hypothetical protein